MNVDDIPDALSEVLGTLHLTSVLYCRAEMTAPWGLRFSRPDVATFHAVRSGTCWLRVNGSSRTLAAGDFVVFPQGADHDLLDQPRRAAEPIESVVQRLGNRTRPMMYGGGGTPVTLLCGHFGFDRSPVHPLLSLLPPVIHVRGDDGRAAPRLEAVLGLLAHEAARAAPGATAVVRWATNILFVQMLRSHLESIGDRQEGWLRGMRDGPVARALVAIHERPEHDWSLTELARVAGQSRSVFCERFARLVGDPPHRYLMRWRIYRATQLIQNGDLTLKEVAERIGIGDEAAFSKAFKRHLGVPPAVYRGRRRALPVREAG
jgi:AraC family transcriptional regulator, alkane utilization regulator